MTITLPLQPEEEARLEAVAHARGLSTSALMREALDEILAGACEIPNNAPVEPATGASLVAAMQASPHKELDLKAGRAPLPVRDMAF
jgi:ferritin-like metal-binding protein YciE